MTYSFLLQAISSETSTLRKKSFPSLPRGEFTVSRDPQARKSHLHCLSLDPCCQAFINMMSENGHLKPHILLMKLAPKARAQKIEQCTLF